MPPTDSLQHLNIPLDRDIFLRSLIRELAGTMEGIIGYEEAAGYISLVAQNIGDWLNSLYLKELGVTALSPQQVGEVLVDLKRRIQGCFTVVQQDAEKIVFTNRACPFGDKVVDRPSMCMMTSNVFGVIAASNLGYAKVVLDETIALGSAGCRVIVFLQRSQAALAAGGREYYGDHGHVSSAPDVVIPITARKRAERKMKDDEKRTEALLKLSRLPWVSKNELIALCLEEAVRLTGSAVGYLHLLDEDQKTITLANWSKAVAANCSAKTVLHYPLDKAGIWADCVRRRQPVIHNDYPNHPGRKGVPDGHLPLTRHLSIPLLDNGLIVAIAGVGNKVEPYDELDARQLSLFMTSTWSIFKQKQMELDVLSAKEEWEMTFDAIDEVVTIHDLDMKVVRANRAAAKTLGLSPAEMIGKHCHELFSGLTEACPGCPEVMSRNDGTPHSATIHHDKLAKTFEVSSFPLIAAEGVKGFVHIAKDITEHKMLEAQLRQAQKMEAIGTLAGGIAHDFNNILVPILGYAELAMDREGASGAIVSDIKQITQAAHRAKDLVKQILAFSRQAEHERWPLEPHLVIKEALKLLRASLPTTIEIRQNIPTDCGAIIGDPTQLHQIIMNLCTNAYHAMRDTGGVLGVSLTKLDVDESDRKAISLDLEPGPYLQLEVSDSGIGMDRHTLDRIFEPYFTTKPKGEGTGMGLAVVHGIVKSYHGHIAVYSEPGGGTTFHVYLPRVKAKPVQSEPDAKAPLPNGTERILLVDDEKTITSMLQMMLEKRGYVLTTVNDSPEAMALFQKDPTAFDLLITDMTMPVLTGFDLARRVLTIRPDMPIILITGFSELINKAKADAIGIRAFLMKPATSRDLALCVRKVLDGEKLDTPAV